MRYCKLATPKSWLSRQLTPRYSWPAVCRVWRFFFTPRDEGSFTQSGVSIGHQSDSRLSRFSLKKTNVFEARVLYGKNNEHSSVPVPWLLYYVLYRTDTGKFQNCQSTIVDTKIFVVQPRFRWHSLAASLKLFSTSYLFHYSETNTALTPKFRSYKISRNVCLKTL